MAHEIDAIASARHVSRDRAVIDLLHDAISACAQRKNVFLELAERFQNSTDPAETERLREELAQLTFGS